MSNFNQRISALESRPTGVQPVPAGGNPNPGSSPPATAGGAAPGVGHGSWTPDDWVRWRAGAWYRSQPTPASAG
eukprot:11079513-Alexandrium_andersonii.AAC.1